MDAREIEKCIDEFGTDIYRFCLKLCMDKSEAVLHSEESIEERYLQKELISEVNRIIETLPEKIRIPLTLFYLSNCSVEQISTIIKKPPGTVKSRLFKGRSLIKKRLEEAGYEK